MHKCGERHEIFGHGGASEEATSSAFPSSVACRCTWTSASPPTLAGRSLPPSPTVPHAQIYRDIAGAAWAELQKAAGKAPEQPSLTVAENGAALEVAFADLRFTLSAEMLRVMSPSAEVQGHTPAQRVTVGGKRSVKIAALAPVGNYATRIAFDDGHDTGLFTWDYLRQLGTEREQRWASYLAELKAKGLDRG